MLNRVEYEFKIASTENEYRQIYALNYETFVQEIPQHPKCTPEILVDKFDEENTYFICLKNQKLMGMVTARSKRPFSLDLKLDNLDQYFPDQCRLTEIRLLAVKKNERRGFVLPGLLAMLTQHIEASFDRAIISGNVLQKPLYRRMGFKEFGPLVGDPEAQFQPMYISRANYLVHLKPLLSVLPIHQEADRWVMYDEGVQQPD